MKIKAVIKTSILLFLLTASVLPSSFANQEEPYTPAVEQLRSYSKFSNVHMMENSPDLEISINEFISALSLSITEIDQKNNGIGLVESVNEQLPESNSIEQATEISISNFQEVWTKESTASEASLQSLKLKAFVQFGISSLKNKNVDQTSFAPFYTHVKDALIINKQRKHIYSDLSNGKTKFLSGKLLVFENSLIPVAKLFDAWARKLRRKGYPVLESDFVSMSLISKAETKVIGISPLKKATKARIKELSNSYLKEALTLANQNRFLELSELSRTFISNIDLIQKKENLLFPLTIHLAESVGLAAKNAHNLCNQYKGKTNRFYSSFIRAQLIGLIPFGSLDFEANQFHTQEIGILVNDLPVISF